MAKLSVNDIQSLSLAILSLESIAGKLGGIQSKRLAEARAIIVEVLTTENTASDESENHPKNSNESGNANPHA